MRQKDSKSTKGVARFTLALKRGVLLDDRYHIEELLADSSSFALTYLATDTAPEDAARASVAIKEFLPRIFVGRARDGRTVKPHSPADATEFARSLRRFVHEGKILVDIASPSLVRVQRCLESNGTGYLVMDVHQGRSLAAALVEAGGRIPARDAVALVLRLLEPLERLQIESVFHRAISPDAVNVTESWEPILHGFSARRHVQGQALELEAGFAAFEQYASNNVGPWTDVYGCAALLYYLVTGVVPPNAIDRVGGKSLPPASAHVPDLSPSLSLAIARGLSLLPEQRPHSVAEFRKQLEAASVEPVNPLTAALTVRSALEAEHVVSVNEGEVDDPIALELAAGGRLVLPRGDEEEPPRWRVFGKLAERARESVRSVMPEARITDLRGMIPNGASTGTHKPEVVLTDVQASDVPPIEVPEEEPAPIQLEPEFLRTPLVPVDQTEPLAQRDAEPDPTLDQLELQSQLIEMYRSDVRRKAARFVTASVLMVAVLGSAYGTLTYRRTPDVPGTRATTTAAKPNPTSQSAAQIKVASTGAVATQKKSAEQQGLSDGESTAANSATRNRPAPAASDNKASVANSGLKDSKSAAKTAPPAAAPTPPATKPFVTSKSVAGPPVVTSKPVTAPPVAPSRSVATAPPVAASKPFAGWFSKPPSARLAATPKPAAPPPVTVSPPVKLNNKRTVPQDILSDVEGRLASGNEEADIGLYSLARRIYREAIVVTDAALEKYSQADTLRSIRSQLNQADQRALRACQAENDSLRKDRRPTIPCE